MHTFYDADEWKTISEHRACTSCNGDIRRCNGRCNGMSSYSLVKRTPEEIAEVKRKRAVEEEDAIIARAAMLLASRALRRG